MHAADTHTIHSNSAYVHHNTTIVETGRMFMLNTRHTKTNCTFDDDGLSLL